MKTNQKTLQYVLLLTSVSLLFSCNKGVVSEEEVFQEVSGASASRVKIEETTSLIGVWKLMKIYGGVIDYLPGEEPTHKNYSHLNITYEFKEDGVLIVTGKLGTSIFYDLDEGTYSYSIHESDISNAWSALIYTSSYAYFLILLTNH